MKNSHYVSIITLLLCAGMTGPLWVGEPEHQQADADIAPEVKELTSRLPVPALSPPPEDRLACGVGILSRLRNRGDRCVAVPQYAAPYFQQPSYVYPQPCAPVQPRCVVPTQPMVTQPMVTQPYVQPAQAAPRGGPCNCQSCCREFQLTRWRLVAEEQEVTEDYIDCEVETSRFCDSSCESGECIETIGIQNKKRHVVKQKNRKFLVTKLVQETVIESRCIECGCIRDTQIQVMPTNTYRSQRPVLEREHPSIAPPNLDAVKFEPAYRQSKRLEWKSAEDK